MNNRIKLFTTFSIVAFLLTSCYTKLALTSSIKSTDDNFSSVSAEYNPVIITPPPSGVYSPATSPVQQRPFEQGGSIHPQHSGSKRKPLNSNGRPGKSKTVCKKNSKSKSKLTARRKR